MEGNEGGAQAPQGSAREEEAMRKATKKAAPKKAKVAASAPSKASDWRRAALARIRTHIQEIDPDVVEEAKWKKAANPAGVPTWSHDGIICTGETYKDKIKLTFAKGAAIEDPSGLFNSSLDGNVRRAIDIREGDRIDEKALKALIRAAVALNTSKPACSVRPQRRSKRA